MRTEHADELHERLRLAAIAGTETEAELVMLRARLAELERAVQAKDEQIEMARLKLKATSDDGRATTNAAQSLATRAEAMAEDLRVKEEQLALLKQSINVMEEEMLAKDSSADATKEKLALLQKECATRDDEILVLSEQLQAAHLEIKVGGSALGRKNEELEQQLAGTPGCACASTAAARAAPSDAARDVVELEEGTRGADCRWTRHAWILPQHGDPRQRSASEESDRGQRPHRRAVRCQQL